MKMGEKIYNLRIKNNMTLEELGDKVGVGKSTVRKWEKGLIANMKRDKIAKLASALGVSPAYLMGWDETLPVEEKKPHTIAAHATEDLDDEDIEEIYRFIDYIKSKKKK